MGLSVALTIVVMGWAVRENRHHQIELAQASAARDLRVNQFLRDEVCERLELRDEIQISYLKAAASKYAYTDAPYAEVLLNAAQALEFTQRGCKAQIPGEG
jgi:hypothetical protein